MLWNISLHTGTEQLPQVGASYLLAPQTEGAPSAGHQEPGLSRLHAEGALLRTHLQKQRQEEPRLPLAASLPRSSPVFIVICSC